MEVMHDRLKTSSRNLYSDTSSETRMSRPPKPSQPKEEGLFEDFGSSLDEPESKSTDRSTYDRRNSQRTRPSQSKPARSTLQRRELFQEAVFSDSDKEVSSDELNLGRDDSKKKTSPKTKQVPTQYHTRETLKSQNLKFRKKSETSTPTSNRSSSVELTGTAGSQVLVDGEVFSYPTPSPIDALVPSMTKKVPSSSTTTKYAVNTASSNSTQRWRQPYKPPFKTDSSVAGSSKPLSSRSQPSHPPPARSTRSSRPTEEINTSLENEYESCRSFPFLYCQQAPGFRLQSG
ncbi:hypothetical protein QCA50_008980 [Cerrena zonata]|uniref:Uncharacterized protein n=1 Tax=Cerrena zonata TaxID=2478898 RepID=A0AAW0G4G6_9APHY